MALLESCCGCGLAVSSAVLGVYLLVAYIIAFTIELWWILESPVTLPIPAYLLCLGYFILFTFSALLLHGLSVKRTTFLLVWLFMMGILLGPEAGLVLYLSIHYWRITSMYGLIEVTCWTCRLLVNAVGLLCVQSLHSIWREEKSVLLRLEALKSRNSPAKVHQEGKVKRPSASSVFQGYKNYGFEGVSPEKTEVDSYGGRFRYSENGGKTLAGNEDYVNNYVDPYFADGSGFSEFNASSFDPTVIDGRLENVPYCTMRRRPKELDRISEEAEDKDANRENIPKTRSLIDFTDPYLNEAEVAECPTRSRSPSASLDRKIIKNKNLKILKKLSPFFRKKNEEFNIYRVQPGNISNLDSQLNKIYSNRGMYFFDQKTRRVVFYPPEYFAGEIIRKRLDSYGSSRSRSSVDSEDIRHIGDVAL